MRMSWILIIIAAVYFCKLSEAEHSNFPEICSNGRPVLTQLLQKPTFEVSSYYAVFYGHNSIMGEDYNSASYYYNWMADSKAKESPWIQVDFGSLQQLDMIGTRGNGDDNSGISTYTLQFSEDGEPLTDYYDPPGVVKEFDGSIGFNTVWHKFSSPLDASVVRLNAVSIEKVATLSWEFLAYCDKVDGGWSEWSSWGNCNEICGQGIQERRRPCSNPHQANGGLPCGNDGYLDYDSRDCIGACPEICSDGRSLLTGDVTFDSSSAEEKVFQEDGDYIFEDGHKKYLDFKVYDDDYSVISKIDNWRPNIKTDQESWIQVDLKSVQRIEMVGIRGDNTNGVTEYSLKYSDDGATFTYYEEPLGSEKFFIGTTGDTLSWNTILNPFNARFVRLMVEGAQGYPVLSWELLTECASTGGDADPHFIIRMAGSKLPICFNYDVRPGSVVQLVHDVKTGLTVNAKLISKFAPGRKLQTWMGTIAIIYKQNTVFLSPKRVRFNFTRVSWGNTLTYINLPNQAKLTIIDKKKIILEISDHVKFVILRHTFGAKGKQPDYLGFFILNQEGLSKSVHGLIGQFMHETVAVENNLMTSSSKDHNATLHFPKTLRKEINVNRARRYNTYLQKSVTCWFVHNNGRDILNADYMDYLVPNLLYSKLAPGLRIKLMDNHIFKKHSLI